jgi:hypothetical protein
LDVQGYISEIADLKKQIEELVHKNVHWQKFHEERERVLEERNETILRLNSRLAELMQHVQQLEQNLQQQQQQQRDGDGGALGNRYEGLANSRVVELENQLLQQKNKMAALEDNNIELSDEIRKLKKQLNQTRPATRDSSQELEQLLEQVQVLQVQLTVNKEDFEMERRDRERSQQKVDELEQLLLQYRGSQGKNEGTSIDNYYYPQQSPSLRYTPTAPYTAPVTSRQGFIGSESRRLVHTGPGLYYADHVDAETDGELATESAANVEASAEPHPRNERGKKSPQVSKVSSSTLRCPTCQLRFSFDDDHTQFIEHLSVCK